MDITTVNLDRGRRSPEFVRNESRVKFELMSYPPDRPKRRGPVLSKILKVIGAVGTPVGFALAPFTGGLSAIAGWGAMGLGSLGAKSGAVGSQPPVHENVSLSYPGISAPASGYQGNLITPTALSSGDPTLDLVTRSRDNAAYSAIHQR